MARSPDSMYRLEIETDEFPKGTCETPMPMSMPRSQSLGPLVLALRREIKSVTAIVSVGGFAKLGTCVWNSDGTCGAR